MFLAQLATRLPRRGPHTRLFARFYASASNGSTFSHSGSWQRQWGGRAATAAAIVAAAGSLLPLAQGDADLDPPASMEERRQQFRQWLAANGADFAAADVKESKDPGAGLGLFATPELRQHMSHWWLGRRVGAMLLPGANNQTVPVLSIPLDLALTARSACTHPQLGSHYSELLDLGVIDERNAVILMLMIEKLRGQASSYAPYINVLPDRFNGPLFYDEQQQQELAGTTLAAAAAAQREALAATWQRLQPAAAAMLQQVGAARQATLDDFKWASSVFWSRGLGLPVTIVVQQQQQQEGQQQQQQVGFEVWEGLVPGIDFANHSQTAHCWWEVVQQRQQQQQQHAKAAPAAGDSSSSGGGGDAGDSGAAAAAAVAAADGERTGQVVRLMTNRACCPSAGDELTISYGDKCNEELLLLYGFALPDNPAEMLMLLCPVPPADEWDHVFTGRMRLLQAQGLRPQLFLSASHLRNCQPDTAGRQGVRPGRCSVIPPAARDVITAFVMQPKELFPLLQQLEQQQEDADAGNFTAGSSSSGRVRDGQSAAAAGLAGAAELAAEDDALQSRAEQLGLDMAVLTTFVRLLELKMVQQEGDEGTGPLEDDLRLLQEEEQAAGAGGSGDPGEVVGLPGWMRSCVLYRAGQKQLVRGYLRAARQELQETLTALQALMEAMGQSSE